MVYSYLGDEEATKSAFDNEGFYKTGDIVRRVGKQYFYEGRASCDCEKLLFYNSNPY